MAGLEETLALDYTEALSGADELEDRLTSVARSVEGALSDAFTGALGDAEALGELAGESLAKSIADGAQEGIGQAVDSLAGTEAELAVTVDDSAVEDIDIDDVLIGATVDLDDADFDALYESVMELDGEAVSIDVEVDSSGLEDATSQASGFTSGMGDAAAGAQELGTASQEATGESNGLADALGGVSDVLGEVAPGFSAATVGAAAFAATVGLAIGEAITAESSTQRLERAFGDSVATAVEYDDALTGVVGTLEELAVATGSSDDDLKFLIARFAETGQSLGFTREQTAEAAASYAQLALFVAATRPELGSAEVVAGRLARALATGGRFASDMGIPLASAGEIAEAAAAKFGKPVEALTQYEKQVAGLELATERLGPAIGAGIAAGVEDPIVKLRALQTAIGEAIEAAGQPLVAPFLDSLDRVAPILEDVIGVVGDIGAGAVGPLAAALGGALSVLEVFADVLDSVPAPLLASAGAFLAASKGAALLLPLLLKIAPAARTLATNVGAIGTAAKFDNLVAQFRGAERAVTTLTTKVAAAQAANTAYASALVTETAAGNAAAAAAFAAHTAAVEADSAVLAANAAVNEANLRVKAAEIAVAQGQTGAEVELVAAREAQATATAALAGAEQRAAVARTQSTAAGEAAVASARGNAAELAALSAATTTNAQAAQGAAATVTAVGGAAGGAAALIGPLSILLGVGAAAWALWGSKSKEASEDVENAATVLQDYTDQLGLTNTELANLSTDRARSQFQASREAADEFFATLEEADQADAFNDLNLNLSTAGEAINGNREQLEEFRRELVRSGEVKFTFPEPGGTAGVVEEGTELYNELLESYARTGEVTVEAEGAIRDYSAAQGDLAVAFEEQVAAAEEAREAVIAEAEAELEAANAADTNALAQLAATGQLSELGREGEVAARILLEQADAQQQTADTAIAYEVAAGAATDATGRLIEAAGRAATAFANGDPINTGDLGAARALAASDAFDDLPTEVQDSINALLDFADAEIETANASGELISSLGEVATSLVELQDELEQAIDKFDSLRGAQGRFNAEQRDIASGIRGIDDQVRDLGASLDANGAAFDVAGINANNYREYLALLSDEQQRAIEQARVPDGTNEDGTPKDRALTDEEAAARVRDAILGSAEAMGRANDEAKDNADALLDYFDSVTGKIAQAGQEAIARGEDVGAVNARVADQVRQFRDAAIAAGVAEGAVDQYLATVGLNPITGFSQEQLDTSGITNAVSDLERLRTVIGFLPKDVQLRIEAETDPEEQRKLIEESLQTLGPEFAVQVDTYLAATTPEEASAALAAIQQTIDRLQIVKVALGIEVDPNADPATQLQQIQDAIGDKTEGAQVAIRTFLQAPDPVAAQFALDSIVNRAAAAQAVVKLVPSLTEEAAAQAVIDITKFNNDPANAIKLPVTVETAGLVAQVNAGYEGQLRAIELDASLSESEKEELRNELERQRTAELTVIAETGQASKDVDALTAEPQEQEVKVKITVPDWAKWIVGYPGARPPARSLNLNDLPIFNVGGRPTPGRRPSNGDPDGDGRRGQRGGTTFLETYAAGGARVDPRILRRLAEMDGGLDQVGPPQPGLYGPGQYVTFAEDGTAGEYLISRSPTQRTRNQDLVRTAAADLGVSLAPQVTVAAPQVSVAAPSTDPDLVDSLRRLAQAQATARPARTTTIAPGAIVVNEARDARRTADRVSGKFTAESFLQGDI